MFEAAIPEAPQQHVATEPKDGEIDDVVAIHVERIGTGDRIQIGRRVGQSLEAQPFLDRAPVAIQRGRCRAPGQEEVRTGIRVAVERRDTAADEEGVVALVGMLDAGRRGDVDKSRGRQGDGRCGPSLQGAHHHRSGRDGRARRHERDRGDGHGDHAADGCEHAGEATPGPW